MKKTGHPPTPDQQLVLFTSQDGVVSLQATLNRETVWLTQEQMAQVFAVKRPAVTKHLRNIFETGELDQESARSILEHTAADGKTYATVEEKAANLFYFIVKNHAFTDGNKRIGAALFLYFMDKNRMLFTASGAKRIADHTLVALTLMIAESKPDERELMVNLVMTFLAEDNEQLKMESGK
jgi:prophage maintenance system killer protein